MPGDDVVVLGIGMMTAVGLTAVETAASVRAGVMRFTESTWRDHMFEPFTVAEVLEDGLPELAEPVAAEPSLTYREQRLLRLATAPLAEALKPRMAVGRKPGLAVALPDRDTNLPLDRQAFVARLSVQSGGAFDPALSCAEFTGRAGGLSAIAFAAAQLQSGRAGWMLAGGVDTYRDLWVLGVLDAEKRVKSSSNADGFIPGEGAAFLLLARRDGAAEARLTPLARLSPVARSVEPGHLYSEEPYRAEGLAAALAQLWSTAGAEQPVAEAYSSMNGEHHWAKEWGVAYLRNRASIRPEHGIHHPADCFGETGAACGPLMAGLATLGMMQGYRRSPCLVYCSSDSGERAALTVASEWR